MLKCISLLLFGKIKIILFKSIWIFPKCFNFAVYVSNFFERKVAGKGDTIMCLKCIKIMPYHTHWCDAKINFLKVLISHGCQDSI